MWSGWTLCLSAFLVFNQIRKREVALHGHSLPRASVFYRKANAHWPLSHTRSLSDH